MIWIAIGWIGTAFYIIAHSYLTAAESYDQRLYLLANLLGGLALLASSAVLASWQSVAINVFWVLISVIALVRGDDASNVDIASPRPLWTASLLMSATIAIAPFNLNVAINALGWIGVALYIAAYSTLALGQITRQRFLVCNIVAAIGLLPVYFADANWPAYAVSIAWAAISAVGLKREPSKRNDISVE